MKLYQENAKKLVGKMIDCKVRRFGYYPMEVKKRDDGTLYVKDAAGVCMDVPEREDDFNCHDYNFVLGEDDCFISNNEPYPLCKGNGNEYCHDCCKYENYEQYHSPY